MSVPSVCVSILHWYGREKTEACLDSLQESDHDAVHVVLVNNGPASEADHFRTEFPDVDVVQTEGNVGFAPGHNRGLEAAVEADDDYVFFLNNDAVVESDTISALVDAAEGRSRPALYTPYVYTRTESGETKCEFTAGYFDWIRGEPYSYESDITPDAKPLPDPLEQADIDYLHGAALFGPTEVVSSLGGFEEKFFIYYEDSDISQRAKAAGIDLVPVPKSEVYHLEYEDLDLEIMADFRAYFVLRNKFWFMFRHAPRRNLPVFLVWYLTYRLGREIYYSATERDGWRHARYALAGVVAAMTGTKFYEETVRSTVNEAIHRAAFE